MRGDRRTQRKRPRWSDRVLSSAVATILLSQQLAPAAGFGVPTLSATRQRQHIQYFRNDNDHFNTCVYEQQNAVQLPTWLAIPRSHLSERNLEDLHRAMRSSFFTETEALKLVVAIEEASGGDRNLVAGSAEFCRILVETMEMGLNALVAGAFHYCACVNARTEQHSHIYVQAELERFGSHSIDIAKDAARLKQLELVAAKVMQNDTGRVRPDSKDAENLRKLLLLETHDWRGLAIRCAASLYRLRGIAKAGGGLTRESVRVAREALSIYAPLASRLGMHRLKNELEGAAFRMLYRRQYERVNSRNDAQTHNTMKVLLEDVRLDMIDVLEQDEEFMSLVDNFSVTARVKEPYSMWKKMLLRGYHDIRQVPDSIALRIVLDAKKLTPDEPEEVTCARERALCYYAQKLCTRHWTPVLGNPRFKDYIESPKANGYQSLHYTAHTHFGGEDWTLEIQVRSREMHQVAEFGLASHWDYKAQQNAQEYDDVSNVEISNHEPLIDRSSEAYLRKVQEWHWDQQAAAAEERWDASPASNEPVTMSDIWQGKVRADRIRDRTQRLEPYIEALTTAQSDLAREYVFVFVTQSEDESASEGKVMALPSGACVLDALREGEKTMGFPLFSIDQDALILNGGSTSVTRQLQNGDVLTLPLARTPAVSM